MAVPLKLRGIPEYLRNPQFAANNNNNGCEELLQFPKSKCVLWDGVSTGPPVFLHVAQYRKPKIEVGEKVLWLIHKQVEPGQTSSTSLVGSLSVDEDAEGVCFHIDGVDTRQSSSDSSLIQGDVVIPIQVSSNSGQDRTGTVEDYVGAIQLLEKCCGGRDSVDLSNLLRVRGYCHLISNQGADKTVAHVQFDLVTMGTAFKATPVNPVPIFPTALAVNLGGPRSLSNMQGRPKIGYLTMDHTHKLILVLEMDPKVSSLPIVGIWVSGVPMVQHPFVWASCLRYLHSEQLQDRVCVPPEGFLLVVYTTLHSKPEFYEVGTTSGKPDMQFDMYTGYEVTSLFKKSSGPEPEMIEWELSPVRNGPKRELFDAALDTFTSQGQASSSSGNAASPAPPTSDDINPRMKPAPHYSRAMEVRPMVPEVSMIWNDSVPPPVSQGPPFPSAGRQQAFTAANHQGFNTAANPAFSSTAHRPSPGPQRSGGVAMLNGPRPAGNRFVTTNRGGHQFAGGANDSDCTPRAAAPLQATQMGEAHQDPNSQPHYPSTSSTASGFPTIATAYMGHPSRGPVPQPYPQSCSMPQAFPLQQAPNSQQQQQQYFPLSQVPANQGAYTSQPYQPQPQPYVQTQPVGQPTPRPRLMAPTSMNFCRPGQAGPTQQPSVVGARLPAYSVEQSQNGYGCPPMSCGQPDGQSWPNHPSLGAQSQQQPKQTGPQCINNGPQGTSGPYTQHPSSYPAMSLPQGQQGQRQPQQFESYRVPNPPTTVPQAGQVLNASSHSGPADSTSCSGKSSDDSGLSVTPDRSNPSPKPGAVPSAGEGATSLQSVNWSGVPGEVVQLLLQQDAQLKMLQAQIQQLLTQQQAASPSSASTATLTPTAGPSSAESSPATVRPEVRSTAVNTTMMGQGDWDASPTARSDHCVQTSPQKAPPPSQPHFPGSPQPQEYPSHSSAAVMSHNGTSSLQQGPFSPFHYANQSPEAAHRPNKSPHFTPLSSQPTPPRMDTASAGQTPVDFRHQGHAPLSSTQHDGASVHSSLVSTDQPSPARLSESQLQASYSTPSPQSASMCVRPDEDEEEDSGKDVSPDSKEYYDQLISNIKLFLNNHSDEGDSSDGVQTDSVSPDDQTCTRLKLLDSTVAVSPSLLVCPSGGGSSNTTMTPHINYLSMMLGSDASSDTSLEINAMAMKYLRDEQLTQMARFHQASPHRASNSNQLLRQIFANSLETTGLSDVSRVGLSASNMSMASRKYMERHGLMGGDGGETLLDVNQTLRLQTDFSMAVVSEPHFSMAVVSEPHFSMAVVSEPHFSSNPPSAQSSPFKRPGGVRSPVKREVLQPVFQPSPAITEERDNSYRENSYREHRENSYREHRENSYREHRENSYTQENSYEEAAPCRDLGASPALQSAPTHRYHQPGASSEDTPTHRYHQRGASSEDTPTHQYHQRGASSEDTPIFPERYCPPSRPRDYDACSVATDDDRILDIEKLKQMPKLL